MTHFSVMANLCINMMTLGGTTTIVDMIFTEKTTKTKDVVRTMAKLLETAG